MKCVVIDLSGQKFGKWTILEKDSNPPNKRYAYWICKCECGTIKSCKSWDLRNNKTSSCYSCSLGENQSLEKIGTFIEAFKITEYLGLRHIGKTKRRYGFFRGVCVCGKSIERKYSDFQKSQSCGCLSKNILYK